MKPDDLGDSPILLDTGVFSFAFTGRAPHEWYEPFLRERLWVLSFATVGELRFGAIHAGWARKKRQALEDRIGLCVVLPGNDAVSEAWAQLNRQFRDQISQNDLWIVATALSQDPPLPIATHDATMDDVAVASGIMTVREP